MWCTSAAGLQRALPIPQSTAISQHAAEQRRCIIGSTRAPPPAAADDDDLWLRRLAAAPLAALLLLAPLAADVPAAQAAGSSVQTNVRLQDVESATLKAGLTAGAGGERSVGLVQPPASPAPSHASCPVPCPVAAATEGRLAEAERLFKLYLITEDPQSARWASAPLHAR